jgi:DnaJ-class molecular chaperone
MKKFDEITEARKILELPEKATLENIKENYRTLLYKWHPDKCTEESELSTEMTRRIISAYKTITAYCNHYQFSFTQEEIEKTCSAKEWWFEQFGKYPWF